MQSARSDTIKELPRTLPLPSACSPYKRTTKPLRYFGFDKQQQRRRRRRRRRRLSYLSNKTQQNIRLKMHLQLNSINFNRFHSRPATRRPTSVTNLCADRQRTPNAAPRGLAWVMWDEVRSHRGSLCASLSHALSILLLRTHTRAHTQFMSPATCARCVGMPISNGAAVLSLTIFLSRSLSVCHCGN